MDFLMILTGNEDIIGMIWNWDIISLEMEEDTM